ncbi:MAG TPA: FkbM family methyltransferase [Saprospiraceae bacterium]|nr:FkbM family methyltransferase [Saprospiraceae bacterium]HMP24395.1 FkbM family methyltransferase [Saprospiraceae bacterium]
MINNWLFKYWNRKQFSHYEAAGRHLLYRQKSYDRFIIEEIWERNEYFLSEQDLPAAGVIIDIGAHIGAFALRANALFPTHRILAFEPVADNFKLLKKNIAINGCSNIEPIQAAITGSTQRLNLYLSKENTAGHSQYIQPHRGVVNVPAIPMAQLFARYAIEQIALLKIDCEGSEYDILKHLTPEQLAKIHHLCVEYHPVEGYNFTDLQNRLTAQGFCLVQHKEGYLPGQGTALFIHKK